MQDLQEIFNRIQEAKKQQKDIRTMYKDILNNSQEYSEITDKMKTLRERKKQVELSARQTMDSEFTKLEDLTIDIASDMELLSDIALNKVMKKNEIKLKNWRGSCTRIFYGT